MSETHCDHGKSYVDDDCAECDRVWVNEVVLPATRRDVARLLRFYDQQSLIGLIFSQAHHVEKLQSKKTPVQDTPAFRRVREG